VGSWGGTGQVVAGRDVPRRRRDDGVEEVAWDGGVSVGEAAPAVDGGLRVLRPETEARGAAVGASEQGGKKRHGGGGFGWWAVVPF
jgi:hypothetical protein